MTMQRAAQIAQTVAYEVNDEIELVFSPTVTDVTSDDISKANIAPAIDPPPVRELL